MKEKKCSYLECKNMVSISEKTFNQKNKPVYCGVYCKRLHKQNLESTTYYLDYDIRNKVRISKSREYSYYGRKTQEFSLFVDLVEKYKQNVGEPFVSGYLSEDQRQIILEIWENYRHLV